MKDLYCPYCDADVEICHDDGFGCSEDETYHQQRPECDKYFVFTTSISIDHYAHAAECLNDGNHKFKLTTTFPKEFSRWRCGNLRRRKANVGRNES